MISKDTRRASLAALKEMRERGEIDRGGPAEEDDRLPAAFWEEADLSGPRRRSVHLRLDAEVFDYFRRGGKGHLTRMQNVLAAYVKAQRQR